MEDINLKADMDELNDSSFDRIEATEDQKRAFGLQKHHGEIKAKKSKPTNGKLMIEVSPGKWDCVNGCYDLPFALLQSKKLNLIATGIKSHKLKIKYL